MGNGRPFLMLQANNWSARQQRITADDTEDAKERNKLYTGPPITGAMARSKATKDCPRPLAYLMSKKTRI
jgi:hypothetical protein